MRTITIKPDLLKLIFIGIFFLVGSGLVSGSISLPSQDKPDTNYWVISFGIFVGLAMSIYCIASATAKIQLTPTSLTYTSIFEVSRVEFSSVTNLLNGSARSGRILNIYYSDKHKSISQFSFSYKQLKFIEKYLLHHCHQLARDKE